MVNEILVRALPGTQLVALAVGLLGCASTSSQTITGRLLAHEPLCLAIRWNAAPPRLEARQAPDTLILLPSQGPRSSWAEEYDLWGDVVLAPSQRDRKWAGSVWGLARDSLHLWGSSAVEVIRLILVRPGSGGAAEWFYNADLGPSMRGKVAFTPFDCGTGLVSAP
jgi:hypothetical protein